MACDRCDELEERVAYLESELGARVELDEVAAVRRAWSLTGSEARLVLALYRAKGRIVATYQLDESVRSPGSDGDRDPQIIAVFVSKIRKKAGRDFIATEWGRGFSLPPASMELVGQVLDGLNAARAAA